MVLGRQRRGVNVLSLVATLREEARMPFPTIQRYLDTVQQRRVSAGAIVGAIRQTAPKAQPMVAGILDRVRASPVVHADETGPTKPGRRNRADETGPTKPGRRNRADETGWRQSGANGYVWTFSTPTERYFLRRGRGKTVVDEALSDAFSGVLVSDCYAAYHHYDGPKQRCWAHLLRDIHDQRTRYPDAAPLARWADAVHGIYDRAKACTPPQEKRRRTAQLALERQLWPSANPSGTTRRQLRPSCADALNATSGNSLSSWPNPQRLQTTTPPSAACATWSSVARSAAAPARNRAHRAR